MNLKQAKSLKPRDELHYVGKQACARTIGPRGGEYLTVTKIRVSASPQTWKRQPERVQVPVKFGMYVSSYITEDNLQDFHLADECPLHLEDILDRDYVESPLEEEESL